MGDDNWEEELNGAVTTISQPVNNDQNNNKSEEVKTTSFGERRSFGSSFGNRDNSMGRQEGSSGSFGERRSFGGGGGGGGGGRGDQIEDSLAIDSAMVSRVIGKAGATVNEIKSACRVRVDMPKRDEMGGATTANVKITGNSQEDIDKAKKMIQDIISGNYKPSGDGGRPPRDSSSGGGGRSFGSMSGGGGFGANRSSFGGNRDEGERSSFGNRGREGFSSGRSNQEQVEDTIKIEPSMISRVIGKAGATVSEIRNSCNVKIDMPKRDEPNTGVIKLTGSQSDIDKAKKMIEDVVSGNFRPSGDGGRPPRDSSSGGGGGRSFGGMSGGGGFGANRSSFGGNRDEGERSSFGNRGGDRESKPEGAEEKKTEKYIPPQEDDSEAALFHTISTGINFDKQNEIKATLSGNGAEHISPISSFEQAKLSELLFENVKRSQYLKPTPVQRYAIPIINMKRDLMACAQTGSGKTAAYVLPIMTNILHDGIISSSLMAVQQPQALILSPTRELAVQIYNECRKFSYQSMIKSGILYGGVNTHYQLENLQRGCNILVATPGRLLDVLEKGKVSLEKVKYFILDEADRMLDMGFEKNVRDILTKGLIQQKGERVTLMFSATFPKEIQQLAQDFLNDYLFLTVGILGGANTDVQQIIHRVKKTDKKEKVVEILNDIGGERTMIFIEQKTQADVLAFFLIQKNYPATSIHGDRLQSQREIALNDFKTGKSKIIVCTSVAARGLDIEKVNYVINYDMPNSIDEYVHRIGRTGRCGNLGKAISFFDPDNPVDRGLGRSLVRTLTQAQQEVPEWLNSIAEDSIGSQFAETGCTDDLRNKMSEMKFSKTSMPAPSSAISAVEEESWD